MADEASGTMPPPILCIACSGMLNRGRGGSTECDRADCGLDMAGINFALTDTALASAMACGSSPGCLDSTAQQGPGYGIVLG